MFNWGKKKAGQAKRRQPTRQAPSLQWRKSWNWVFLLIPLALFGGWMSQGEDVLPIRQIHLSGNFVNLDQREVETTLERYLGQGFFSLDIHELQQVLHDKPWTDSVSVRRVWPDRLQVTIVEKKPVARWDDEHLLSDRAVVFRADPADYAHLPLVHAVNHRPDWVLQRFHRLQARFASVDETVVALRVDSRGALDVSLINGLEIKFGRDDVERKIDRLVRIYTAQILPRRERIERLDLRYSNGFAVAWKDEVLQANDKASLWSNSNV